VPVGAALLGRVVLAAGGAPLTDALGALVRALAARHRCRSARGAVGGPAARAAPRTALPAGAPCLLAQPLNRLIAQAQDLSGQSGFLVPMNPNPPKDHYWGKDLGILPRPVCNPYGSRTRLDMRLRVPNLGRRTLTILASNPARPCVSSGQHLWKPR
jgi:hypothetical protein